MFLRLSWICILLMIQALGFTPAQAEGELICEATSKAQCLEPSEVKGKTFTLPGDALGLSRRSLSICDSNFLYTTAPDIILILDNTTSMRFARNYNGLPRYCDLPADPNAYVDDPGCLSGDPDTLRALALQSFVDSALVKGGPGTRVAVILFADRILNADKVGWMPLNEATKDSVKAEIYPVADGATNYSIAFKTAYELLKTSNKPKEEQTIIFVSDGRPNKPDRNEGGPYQYKQYIDNKLLPPVHSIFLGDQSINFQDLQDISSQTGGLFFAIRDVTKMASILTDSIAKQVFKRAFPSNSTVANLTNKTSFTVPATGHLPNTDTTAYTLRLPGPLTLSRGLNDILIRTQYGQGGQSVDLQFKIQRGGGDAEDTADFGLSCRPKAQIALLNSEGRSLSANGEPYGLSDSAATVRLITQADLDTFDLAVTLKERSSARTDQEIAKVAMPAKAESVHVGSVSFAHLASEKTSGNSKLDGVHGDAIIATWHNPWLPEDSAVAATVLRYGPDVLSAAIFDEDSDGRAETMRMTVEQELNALPSRLRLRMKSGDGNTVERIALESEGEIAFGQGANGPLRDRLIVTLKSPFPEEATSLDPVGEAGHFFRQENIPLVDADFAIDDSVAPAIFSAEIKEIDRGHTQKRITLTFTEAVTLDAKALRPLIFKREERIVEGKDIPIDRIEVLSATEMDVYLQAGAAFVPVGGDSIAIATEGEIRDKQGRAPDELHFRVLVGKTPSQNVRSFFITFGNGSRGNPSNDQSDPAPSSPAFIPVDSVGAALQGNSGGKCGSCFAGDEGQFHGSVIHMQVPGPVRYEFTLFSNLGVFVNRFSGTIEEGDLRFLSRITEGEGDQRRTFYLQRVVWNGLTANGEVAGTGAYLLRSVFRFDRNANTGAKATQETQIKRFGFLRKCCKTAETWDDFHFDPQWE